MIRLKTNLQVRLENVLWLKNESSMMSQPSKIEPNFQAWYKFNFDGNRRFGYGFHFGARAGSNSS